MTAVDPPAKTMIGPPRDYSFFAAFLSYLVPGLDRSTRDAC